MMSLGILFFVFWSMVPLLGAATTLRTSTDGYRTLEHTTASSPPPISDHRFFLHEIFTKYGHAGQMTFEGFEHLLESLGLGNIIIQDHDVLAHKEDAFQKSHDTHDHSKKVGSDHGPSKDHRQDGATHTLQPRQKKGHSHPPSVPPTKSSPPAAGKYETLLPPTQNHLRRSHHSAPHDAFRPTSSAPEPTDSIYHYRLRDAVIPELLVNISSIVDQHQELQDQGPEIIIEQCLSPKEILEAFGINQTSSLNPVSFLHLCPAIIYELDQGHCLFRNHPHKKTAGTVTMEQLVYSCIAVLVISLCGLLSVAVIPIMQKWFYHTLLQFLVGLAVGSLSGDALLHLMPHAMLSGEGTHSHDGSLSSDSAEKIAIWRGFAALAGVFFFFVAERLLGALTVSKNRENEAKDNKSIKKEMTDGSSDDFSNGMVGKKLSQYKRNSFDFNATEKEKMHILSTDPNFEVVFNPPPSFSPNEKPLEVYAPTTETAVAIPGHGHGHSHEVPQSVSAVAWMVIMGDGLHNFCDGLAIGAAFASGIEGGISTTVAVFCHELPHELGDFAMLLRTGMRARQALFYNGLSSVLCFLGMAIGLALGNVHSATGWVFAGTAGMFLYIALVDMLPELSTTKSEPNSSSAYQLGVQVLGISTGVSIMLLIANYEQDLQSIVS